MIVNKWSCSAILLILVASGIQGEQIQKSVFDSAVVVNPGEAITRSILMPASADDETLILKLKARIDTSAANGCNYGFQILIDGLLLVDFPFRSRLLNKPVQFTPPSLKSPMSWYGESGQWMTITGSTFNGNWAGTGQDYDFLFDLTGLVTKGRETTLAFKNLLPASNPAMLILDQVKLVTMKRLEVEKFRLKMNPSPIRDIPVIVNLPAGSKTGPKPYEFDSSNRKESPLAQVPFENLAGWTMREMGDAKVSLSASIDYQLWRKQLAKFSYSGGTHNTIVEIRPPSPIVINEPFDAANLIIFGAYGQDTRADLNVNSSGGYNPGINVSLLLEDGTGREFTMDLGQVKATYWTVQHGVLSPSAIAAIKFPMKFKALYLGNCNINGSRNAYLESLTFYMQSRKPIQYARPERPIFPVSDDGMLPTPPAGVKVRAKSVNGGVDFISEANGNVLQFQVRTDEGSLNGITAKWNGGQPFRPMEGGGVRLDIEGMPIAAGKELKMISSELVNNEFIVHWGYAQARWVERYWVRGRTLGVDITSKDGLATGVNYGLVAGLHNPKGIEVPYLMLANKPGPWIGYGDGLFISVFPDWYNSDFSSIDDRVKAPAGDKIGLWGGTIYDKLTDGRRNDLRERILVTISPEFSESIPNHQNPPSPNRERLAPYMYFVESSFLENFLRTTKRYGIDNIICNSFCIPFIAELAAENAMNRWRLHPKLPVERFFKYRRLVKDELGYLFGTYLCFNDLFFTSEYWDENLVSFLPDGNWANYWPGAYTFKDVAKPAMAERVGRNFSQHYGAADNAYLDVPRGPYALDYEAGVKGAGLARAQVIAHADSIIESRKWFGTICGEGHYNWIYAGLTDMDYATIPASHTTHPACDFPLLVDFDLLKIHPFQHPTMMGYGPSIFLGAKENAELRSDTGRGEAPKGFYQYVSASLAYGHMVMAGYGYIPKLSRLIELYALMQGLQKEYLTDTAAEITYHNGTNYLPTSKALADGSYAMGRICVRYSRGLRLQVNYNREKNWTVKVSDKDYVLPPFGWIADKPGEILAFSALLNGERVSYVSCPEYIYMNSGVASAVVDGLDVDGAVWLKRAQGAIRLIPCGDLGTWKVFEPSDLPNPYGKSKSSGMAFWDIRLEKTPANRGCKRIIINTRNILNKNACDVKIIARDTDGRELPSVINMVDETHIQIRPEEKIVDYLLK